MRFGRDVRAAVFHRSLQLSAREVNQLSAASLITRATNDVQQVQLLVVMTCTLVLAAPITVIGGVVLALRQNTGMAWLLVVSMLVLAVALGIVIGRLIPQFRRMQERLDNANRVLREQITGHPGGAGLRARTARGPTLPGGQRGAGADVARGRAACWP